MLRRRECSGDGEDVTAAIVELARKLWTVVGKELLRRAVLEDIVRLERLGAVEKISALQQDNLGELREPVGDE